MKEYALDTRVVDRDGQVGKLRALREHKPNDVYGIGVAWSNKSFTWPNVSDMTWDGKQWNLK